MGVASEKNYGAFRSAPINGHPQTGPVGSIGAMNGSHTAPLAGRLTLVNGIEVKLGRKWKSKMAVATCLKCAGHSFELVPFTPLGASHKLVMVQCSSCGAPIGILDPATTPQIDALKNQIAAIDERLNRIAKALQD